MSEDNNFNPLPPWGGRPVNSSLTKVSRMHFNPLPPWGGRQFYLLPVFQEHDISIHSLRGEGDNGAVHTTQSKGGFQSTPSVGRETSLESCQIYFRFYFNPLPPWGGRRPRRLSRFKFRRVISIHSLRGEGDGTDYYYTSYGNNFNPLPPWGGRQNRFSLLVTTLEISIHSLRGEGDFE